jgi:hypothetical protein
MARPSRWCAKSLLTEQRNVPSHLRLPLGWRLRPESHTPPHGKHSASCRTSKSGQPWKVLPYGGPALRVHGAPLGASPVGRASKYLGQVVWMLKVCHCDSPEFGGMRPLKVKVSSTLVAVTSWESATNPAMPS